MKKCVKIAVSLLVCAVVFAGCGSNKLPEVIETTTISVEQDGSITSYLVEEFDKEYYNISELSKMVAEDAAVYNEVHQDDEEVPLTVVAVTELNVDGANKVMVQHKYAEDEDYATYNEVEFFYGTVEDALEEGYDLSALLTGVKDQKALSNEELMAKPEKSYVLVTDAKAEIYCPKKITHVGDGVVYQENGSVDTTNVEGVVVILMQ